MNIYKRSNLSTIMTSVNSKITKPKKRFNLIIEEDIVPINKSQFADNFAKCVQGYHFINSEPINETIWETINSQVLSVSGCAVSNTSSGSHTSGRDITCELGGLSNKSAKYSKNKSEFAISSYRLTTICSEKDCGDADAIIKEINSRKNYEYYSFIIRNELDTEIEYDWYMIPSNYSALSPESYTWEPMFGQRGKKTGEQIGWKTNEINGSKMTITFSMSSQLWITISVTDELKEFIVSSCKVNKNAKYNYLQIYEMFSK